MNILTIGHKLAIPVCKIDLVELLHDRHESKVVIYIGVMYREITFKEYEDALKFHQEIIQTIKETNDQCTELHR